MHDSDDIDEQSGDKAKPVIITFYNLTKGGVDVVDKKKAQYTVARVCYRWPLRIFFSLLDIGGINSRIIFQNNAATNIPRKIFLKKNEFGFNKKSHDNSDLTEWNSH